MNDACHDVGKATTEAEGMRAGQRKRKVVAAAPAFLKRRVGRGEELPRVELVRRGGGEEEGAGSMMRSGRRRKNTAAIEEKDEEHMRQAVLQHVVGGGMLKELYYDVMDFIVPKWDDARLV